MKFCISLGTIELKYIIYCFLSVILYIYIYYCIVDSKEKNIINEHELLYSFCYFLGYLLNVIPEWIVDIKSETKERPKINKILNFFLYCLITLFIGLVKSTLSLINNNKEKYDNKNDNNIGIYDDDFMIIEYLIIFLVSKYAYNIEVYYKHQNISFLILILVEGTKNIYFFIIKDSYQIFDYMIIILVFLNSILYSISYLYIKGLMKYNFISPYRCNYKVGIINVPLIIIIYIIISFTIFGKKENVDNFYYYDNIINLFENIRNLDSINALLLTLLPFAYGIYVLLINKIIYDFTLYHIYIPLLIEAFINEIINRTCIFDIIFLILCFTIELIIILVFLEIIEVKFCGLNENLKRNIESRGIIDSSLINNDENDDEYNENDNESYTKNNEAKK